MDPELLLGLQISLTGLLVTFIALGLLVLTMRLLTRIFPAEQPRKVKFVTQKQPPQADADEQRREELAAALAVGVSLLEQPHIETSRDPSLGKLLEQ